jgi:hypothetical protein
LRFRSITALVIVLEASIGIGLAFGDLSNESTMVIKTEIVGAIGCSGRPGVWGVDEPDPTA